MTREIPIVSPLLGALDEKDARISALADLVSVSAEIARRERFADQLAELARIREEGFAHLRGARS